MIINYKQLLDAGLTKTEAKIYLAVLQLGPSNAGLVSRRSGVHRRSVYDAFDRLIEKGIVGYILENNKRLYQATNPRKFLDIIKEKEINISSIMPELESQFNFLRKKEQTNFYKGKEGIKSVFEDMLNQKEEILVLGAGTIAKEIVKYYFPRYEQRRAENKIKVKYIYDEKDRRDRSFPLAEIKYMPSKYMSNVAYNVYGNKVAIILWDEKPLVVVINNEKFSEGFRRYFNCMWDIAKK